MKKIIKILITIAMLSIFALSGCGNAKIESKETSAFFGNQKFWFSDLGITMTKIDINQQYGNIKPTAQGLYFYIVEFEIGNKTDKTIYFYADTFEIIDREYDTVYKPRFSYFPVDMYYAWEIQPHLSMTGYVVFELPTLLINTMPISIRYSRAGQKTVEWVIKGN